MNPYERQTPRRDDPAGNARHAHRHAAYRGRWANFDQTAAAVAGTQNAENAQNAMTSFGGKWDDPGIAAARRQEIDAAKTKLEAASKR